MKTAVIVLNKDGFRTAELIADYVRTVEGYMQPLEGPDSDAPGTMKSKPTIDILENTGRGGLPELVKDAFRGCDGLIFIMASGIAVRMIAPLVRDKYSDPAVVVVDDARRFAVSLLSGHEGGANSLAYLCAAAVGAVPVISTGTETNKRITVGIGCRKGASADAIRKAVLKGCETAGFEAGTGTKSIRCAASIDIKKYEPGLIEACAGLQLPLRFFSKERINSFCGEYAENKTAVKNVGVRAVAEPCALLAGRNSRLLLSKQIIGDVTIAVAAEQPDKEAVQ